MESQEILSFESPPTEKEAALVDVALILARNIGEVIETSVTRARIAGDAERVRSDERVLAQMDRLVQRIDRLERNNAAAVKGRTDLRSPARADSLRGRILLCVAAGCLFAAIGGFISYALYAPRAFNAGRISGFAGAAHWERTQPAQWQIYARKATTR